MKLATSLLIAFLCIAAIAQVSSEETSKVKVLTTANFDDYVRSKSVVLVEFYAPWCGHCKRLEPVYNEAAGTIGEEEDISLAKVDATVEESLGQRFGIRGFPTIILFKNGAPSKKYEGERTTTAIVSYLRKQAGPALKPVKDASEFSTLSDVAYVGYFANNRSKLYKSYSSVAENLRDNFAFFIVSDASVAKGLHFDKEGIYVLAASSDKPVAYGGASTVNSISDWVWENSLPVASRYKADLKNRYKGRGFPVLKVLTTNSDIKNVEEKLTDLLKKLSQDVSGVLTYVLSTFEENQSENNEFGLKSSPFQAYIHDEMNSMKYKYEGDDSYENLKDWVERYASGALAPFIRSEPVSETQGDVKVVVGNNFKDIVLDPSKDVLLEIYAPWCGHCKKLEPTYNELGAKLKNVENVVIAKLDGTANDVPRAAFKASGFPTILLIPAHNKNNPIPYKGARTVEEFEKFIKDNVKTWNVISAESNPSKDEL